MKIQNLVWTIKELEESQAKINSKPQYQRTEVWTLARKQKLIDSILQGFDLPKFYVRRFADGEDFKYEVTDGQQRMKAIWEFLNNDYKLGKMTGDCAFLSGLTFKELPEGMQKAFREFELGFSEIYEATNPEINELFARLQQGVSLNPAELRNAIPSIFGTALKPLISHVFFTNSKIVDKRFTYQEYLDHVAALVHFNNNKDLKAKSMSELYIELSENEPAIQKDVKSLVFKLTKGLNILKKINDLIPGYFKNKWAFVDILNYIVDSNFNVDTKKVAKNFKQFEDKRRKFTKKTELLLEPEGQDFDQELYAYIMAFNKEGALKGNVERRLNVLKSKL